MSIPILAWLIAIPVLGAMTGLRSMTPMAVLCFFAYRGDLDVSGTWAFWTAKPVTVLVFIVLALGEYIGDKLPMTPNRTAPFPLVARIAFGSLVGALAATGLHGSAVEGGFLGAISALAGTFLSFYLRRSMTKQRGLPDLPIALAEDLLALSLSFLAAGIVTG